jgi:nitrite reductase/ring-hydroxylating ferredoxin subunit
MTKGRIALAGMGLFMLILLIVTACSSQSTAANNSSGSTNPNSVTAKQATITAQLSGDTVSVDLSDVDKYANTRFLVNTATSKMWFMAYKYNSQLYVRADICPPCGSTSFTLTNGTLVCDSCGTVFDAKTGMGIRGACVRYAKQSVQYQNNNGTLTLNGTDLVTAYQNTLNPK